LQKTTGVKSRFDEVRYLLGQLRHRLRAERRNVRELEEGTPEHNGTPEHDITDTRLNMSYELLAKLDSARASSSEVRYLLGRVPHRGRALLRIG
jgi:hypothetical protein